MLCSRKTRKYSCGHARRYTFNGKSGHIKLGRLIQRIDSDVRDDTDCMLSHNLQRRVLSNTKNFLLRSLRSLLGSFVLKGVPTDERGGSSTRCGVKPQVAPIRGEGD